MSNANVQGFTRKELADFYENIILYFEMLKNESSWSLTTRSKNFRKLKAELGLDVMRFTTHKEMRDYLDIKEQTFSSHQQNFIWFHDSQGNSLKSIFSALRNSAAHADIKRTKDGVVWYRIEHSFKGNIKIKCDMRMKDFWIFVDSAKKCKSAEWKEEE